MYAFTKMAVAMTEVMFQVLEALKHVSMYFHIKTVDPSSNAQVQHTKSTASIVRVYHKSVVDFLRAASKPGSFSDHKICLENGDFLIIQSMQVIEINAKIFPNMVLFPTCVFAA